MLPLFCPNCSKEQVQNAMEQLREFVFSELQKYSDELVSEVTSVSWELYLK